MEEHTEKNSVVGGIVWKFAERLLSQGVAFIVSLVLARILSPDDYGVIALVLVFINIADVFVNSGFATSLIQKKDADETDFSTMFYCSFACAVVIYIIIFLCAPLIAKFYQNESLIKIVRVFGLRIPLSTYFAIQSAYVSRHMKFRCFFFSGLIAQIVSGVCGIVMAIEGLGVWALIAQYFATTIVNTLILVFLIPWRPRLLFSMSRARSLMKYGSRILLADLSGTFFNELRSLATGRAYTTADLAYYNKGQQLPQLMSTTMNTTVMTVLFPAMANEADRLEQVKAMAKRSLQCLSYIVFPVLFGMAAVMTPLVYFLYTEKWADCIFYGRMCCIGYAIAVLGIVPVQVLKAIGKSNSVLKLEVFKKPIYVILLLIGIVYNVKAIAITMLAYEIYGTIINLLQMKKHIDYSILDSLKDIMPSFLLAGVMALSVAFISIQGQLLLTLILQAIVGASIYIIGSLIFRLPGFKYLFDMAKKMLKRSK